MTGRCKIGLSRAGPAVSADLRRTQALLQSPHGVGELLLTACTEEVQGVASPEGPRSSTPSTTPPSTSPTQPPGAPAEGTEDKAGPAQPASGDPDGSGRITGIRRAPRL